MPYESPTPDLAVNHYGRVLEITLDRAAKRNALNQAMCEGILALVEAAQNDPTVGAILLRAKGEVFCAGMDLGDARAENAVERTASHARLFRMGEWSTKPIVCAVSGPALGGGLGLVANAHVAICAHGSTFGLTEIRIGMWPFAIYRALELCLGPRRTLELALSSKIFNTPEAFGWGLVSEVVPPFELDDRAEAIAAALANASAETIARGMAFAAAQRMLTGEDAMALALEKRAQQFASPDFAEGVAAFEQKRSPRWPSNQ
ncbi:MAG: enoyl-CoA hydratase/isomerase family protein [Bryobacter sp.]|nr:enoyl-CoA hydratase/isomerase family protein [Bryobacter sp.]